MQAQLSWEDDCRLVVACSGEIEWDATDGLIKKVNEVLAGRSAPQVVIDLERVDFITSAGIGGLLQLRKLVIEHGGTIVIACASPTIGQLLRTVGIDRHVPMLDTRDAARNMFAVAK